MPGPPDGPSTIVWVADAAVTIRGDVTQVPALAVPSLSLTPQAPSPVIGTLGTMPANRCIVSHSGTEAGVAYVRLGPSQESAVLGQIDPGRWSEVLSAQDGWYEIPVFPTETGWVRATDVTENELCAGVLDPVPELPTVGYAGLPPADLCAVLHRGSGTAPIDIRIATSQASDLLAVLGIGRWAEVLESTQGWHRIRIATDETGWVQDDQVILSGSCAKATVPVSVVPVILDPGVPPSNACVALYPGPGVPPVAVHLGPGEPFAAIAHLGNWAEVLQSTPGWYQIAIGPGKMGAAPAIIIQA